MSTLTPDSPQPLNALERVLADHIGRLLLRLASEAPDHAPDGPASGQQEPAVVAAAAD